MDGSLACISETSCGTVKLFETRGAHIRSAMERHGHVHQIELIPNMDRNQDLGLLDAPLTLG